MDKRTLTPILLVVVIVVAMQIFMPPPKRPPAKGAQIAAFDKRHAELVDYFVTKNPNFFIEHPEKAKEYPELLKFHPELLRPKTGDDVAPPSSQTKTDGHGDAEQTKFDEEIAKQSKEPVVFRSPVGQCVEPTITATISARGAAIETLTFDQIKESTFKQVEHEKHPLRDFQPLRVYDAHVRSFEVRVPGQAGVEDREWKHEALEGGVHRFSRPLGNGLVLAKELVPAVEPGSYAFRLRVIVENKTDKAADFQYTLFGPAGMLEQNLIRSNGLETVIALHDVPHDAFELKTTRTGSVEKEKPTREANGQSTRIGYFGLVTKYFACVVVPEGAAPTVLSAQAVPLLELAGRLASPLASDRNVPDGYPPTDAPVNQAVVLGIVPRFDVPAHDKVAHSYLIYAGPRSDEILEQTPWAKLGLDRLIEWGWPEFLSRFLNWVLRGFHGLTGNWGFAIILLTFLVRGLLHPISYRGQKNMMKMQKIGPEMQKLKEKFEGKDGKMTPQAQREFSAATWELYRKHGVNPVGCLGPMFLQIPVFIALYGAVNHVYELRQAPFIFWIKDLSEPDVVLRFPWAILGFPPNTNAISVLPICMIITYAMQSVMQMKNSPPPADPTQAQQQKMMMWMMPVMGYMFWTMPSGLLLYFVTSAILGMIESKYVKRKLARIEAEWKGQPARA